MTIEKLTRHIFLIAVFFILPLSVSFETAEPVLPLRLILLSAFMSALVLWLIYRSSQNNKLPNTGSGVLVYLLASFLFFLIHAVQLVQNPVPLDALHRLLQISLIALLPILLFFSPLRLTAIMASVSRYAAGIAVLLSAIGILQFYHIFPIVLPGNFLVYATMANKNLLASFLVLLVPFILHTEQKFSLKNDWFAAAAIFLISITLVLINSRAAFLALATMLIVLGVTGNLSRGNLPLRRFLLRTTIPVLAGALIGFAAGKSVTESPAAAITSNEQKVQSVSERMLLWQSTVKLIREHPFAGVGFDRWRAEIPRYMPAPRLASDKDINFLRPHNDFLWTWAESGIIAAILFGFIFLWIITRAYRVIRHSGSLPDKNAAVTFLAVILAYLVFAMVDFPGERIVQPLLLALAIWGVLELATANFPPHKSEQRFSRPAFYSVILLVLFASVAGLIIGTGRYQSARQDRKLVSAWRANQWQQVIALANATESRFYRSDASGIPIAYYRGVACLSLNDPLKGVNNLLRANRISPNHFLTRANLASSYAMLERYDEAIRWYQSALELQPDKSETWLNLLVVYYKSGKFTQALEALGRSGLDKSDARYLGYLKVIQQAIDSAE